MYPFSQKFSLTGREEIPRRALEEEFNRSMGPPPSAGGSRDVGRQVPPVAGMYTVVRFYCLSVSLLLYTLVCLFFRYSSSRFCRVYCCFVREAAYPCSRVSPGWWYGSAVGGAVGGRCQPHRGSVGYRSRCVYIGNLSYFAFLNSLALSCFFVIGGFLMWGVSLFLVA